MEELGNHIDIKQKVGLCHQKCVSPAGHPSYVVLVPSSFSSSFSFTMTGDGRMERTDERARTNCLPTLFTFTLHGACAPAPGGGGGGGPSFLHPSLLPSSFPRPQREREKERVEELEEVERPRANERGLKEQPIERRSIAVVF